MAYLPPNTAYIAVIYVVSQFELIDLNGFLSSSTLGQNTYPPFINLITAFYFRIDLSVLTLDIISSNATFITQVNLVYILFLALALIAGFVFSCSKPVSAAVLGTAIAATAVSFSAYGIANVIAGVLRGVILFGSVLSAPITNFITFANFLIGIQTQFVLLAVGVLTALFILSDKCCYRPC